MANLLAGLQLTPQGLAGLAAIPETLLDLGVNTFFDVGATGAEALQDPALFVRGAVGDRTQAEQFQENRTRRRATLPTFEPSAPTAYAQQRLGQAVMPAVQAAAARFPNEAQFVTDLASDPSVQTMAQAIEALGLPVMRAARGVQKGLQATAAAPTLGDEIGGMLMARSAPGGQVSTVTPEFNVSIRQGPLGKTYDTPGATMSVHENAPYAPRKHSLTNIVVDEELRGQGLGSRLMDDVLERYDLDELSTAASSPASVTMLYNRGFRPFGEINATLDESLGMIQSQGGAVTMFTPALKRYTPSRPGELSDAHKVIESDFAKELNDDIPGAIKRYNELPKTRGGKIVAADEARELNALYREDKTLAAAVHEPVSALSKMLWVDKLAEPGKGPVMLMSGGTGAGKTSGLDLLGDGLDEFHGVFDSNLQNFDKAVMKVEQALKTGREVEIMHVYRDPLESFSGGGGSAFTRAMKNDGKGRTVPITSHVATHVGSNKTVKQLAKHYADDDRVAITIIDNTRGKHQQKYGTLDTIPDNIDADRLFKEVKNELEKGRATGTLTEKVYRGFRGNTY